MFEPATRRAALDVLRYMLLSYQHSSQAFHATLPVLVSLVSRMREESPPSASLLQSLAALCHALMYKFPGYPLLYADLLDTYG
jgi:ubiquitin carboxyl-terminal hydrolase 35/38